jgi:hypothetical protein
MEISDIKRRFLFWQNKVLAKGKKTITQRTFYDEVTVSLEGKEKQLQDLFGIFINFFCRCLILSHLY